MLIDLGPMSPNQVYHTVTQTLIPRPIAWVLTENQSKSFNIAPFSYFNAIASDPPLLMLSIGWKRDGSPKDTRRNILERKHFVVHIASMDSLESLNNSSAELPDEVSEVEKEKLVLAEFPGFSLPRIAGCKIAFACSFHEVHEIGQTRQALILGEIRTIFVDDSAVVYDAKGRMRVDATAVGPVSRLGPGEYAEFGKIVRLPIPAA
ncbi:MAG: protein/domain typically associated with flavoprotein oxygenase, DIM6/NTAB family protein [Magnetococcales bacterium]|nr:protein/domain typically associated with flavoprotein oxygenase, DIM6/NTAB family protein [Magnetococcales bacterium]HIJ82888.1 flavin reductase family protein [Magnetococcales bacterium]